MHLFSDRERRALWWILTLSFVLRAALAFRPEYQLGTRPFVEDSYYSLNVARHIAIGEGFTVDGVQPTNGVQPLIVLIYTPLFKLAGGDRWLGVRFAYLFGAIVDCISIYLIALLVVKLRKKGEPPNTRTSLLFSPPVFVAVLWGFFYPIFVHTMNGLETGLYSMFLILDVLLYLQIKQSREKGWIGGWLLLGVLLGLTVLTRIDAVLIVIAFFAFELIERSRNSFRNAFILSFAALVVSSPWWIYNYSYFGSLMPVSGQAEALGVDLPENIKHGAVAFADVLSNFYYLPYYALPLWLCIAWTAFIVLIVVWAANSGLRQYLREFYDLVPLKPLLIGSSLLIVFYTFFFASPHFTARYFHPFRIYWTVVTAISIPFLVLRLRPFWERRRTTALAFLVVLLVTSVGFSLSRHVYDFVVSEPSPLYLTGRWAMQHSDATIGMYQTGTTGFMSPNVVNLDGKTNIGALKARAKNQLGRYLIQQRFTYLADWKGMVESLVKYAAEDGLEYREIDSIPPVHIYARQ